MRTTMLEDRNCSGRYQEKQQKRFYGWTVLFGTAFCYIFSTTPMAYGLCVVLAAMVKDGAISDGAMSVGVSARFFTTIFFSIITGMLFQKIGGKKTLIAGAFVMTLAMAGCAFGPGSEGLYIFFMALMGIGAMAGGVVSGPMVLNNRFDKNNQCR